MSTSNPDEETAIALREAGLPVTDEVDMRQAYKTALLATQRAMKAQALAAEKKLKSLYVDWTFDKLNLNRFR